MIKDKQELTPERQQQVANMETLTNFCLIVASVLKHYVSSMLQQHKELQIKIPLDEKFQWNMLLKTVSQLDNYVFKAGIEQYRKYQNEVKLASFLFLELVAKCDDSDYRLWQFHNLLKSFPTVVPALQPTLDFELDAFKKVLGIISDNSYVEMEATKLKNG
uniref:Uncharacterized protein n=1 Tax=Geladintestivirus 6 TaxID=3233138 RepID=A0AAU8MHX5_9CAUD